MESRAGLQDFPSGWMNNSSNRSPSLCYAPALQSWSRIYSEAFYWASDTSFGPTCGHSWRTVVAMSPRPTLPHQNYCWYKPKAISCSQGRTAVGYPGYVGAGQEVSNEPCKSMNEYSRLPTCPTHRRTLAADRSALAQSAAEVAAWRGKQRAVLVTRTFLV